MTAESWRVAQIVVDRGPSDDSFRGSGYLVAPGLVLTAAHVLAGASGVRVRLDVDQRTEIDVQADRWWADLEAQDGTDLAVIMIPADVTAGRDAEPVRFGRIRDCTAVLAVQALGFPRFKLRTRSASQGDPGVFRDLEQVTGHVPVAANRRQGTLAVYLDDPPPPSPDPQRFSPWEGMSGAAVWAGGRIIGIVAEHHSGEGAGRLIARRIDQAYEQLPEPDLDRLVTWLGLAPAAGRLADVVPAEPGQLLRSAYLEQVHDIAPDALVGRDSELVEWAEFCAGTDPYAWWQAGPWAGKSALASWFVTHPPVGVDIISFFITGRLVGQADSDAFLDAMIEQLNALGPATGGGSPSVAGPRVGVWLSLMAGAVALAEEGARRLVVVVDGLDEDDVGAAPLRGRPSIASMLPRRPPPGARFIITSRPDPGLPDDVPSGHPLRTCTPRHLPVSWVAEDVEKRAKLELQDLLTGDQTAIDVVGYIAGSGGGLTGSDRSALTGAPPRKLDPILRGVFGRSLRTRVTAYSRDAQANPATRVYLFAHETLRVTAEAQLGTELARYREEIHGWIRSYASRGWPDVTPSYAIRGYLRLLTATSDGGRLSALARDSRRHAFLLRATGNDYAVLTEIRNAQRLIAAQNAPDLRALVELAVYRHAISIRNQSIPVGLPAAWARLAHWDHAEALARTITDPDTQAQALVELAIASAQVGDLDRGEGLALTLANPCDRAQALAELATTAAQAGNADRASRLAADAEALARTLTDPDDQVQALAGVAIASAQVGDPDRGEALARTIVNPYTQARALAELAAAAAQAGNAGRASRLAADAETLARTLTDPEIQAQALAELAIASAQAGDLDRGEALARAITNLHGQARALAGVAAASARAGDLDRGEALARTIVNPYTQARALAELAAAAAQVGDPRRASRLAADAETLARTLTDPYTQARALAGVAAASALAGDLDRGEVLARAITDPDGQARALAELAAAAAQVGDPRRASRLAADAEALARTLTDPHIQARALAELAAASALAGDLDRGEALARAITDPDGQARALAELAAAAAQVGDPRRASRLAADAEALARTLTDPHIQARALAELAAASALAGDLDRGEALARAITDPDGQARALAGVAAASARAGDLDRGEALARAITDPDGQARALTELAAAAAQVGDSGRASRLTADAEALARAITDPDGQARALAGVAAASARAGDLDRGEVLARAITDPYTQARALTELAIAAAWAGDLDRGEALAGTIANPFCWVQAFTGLAVASAQVGDPDRARHLLALALSGEELQIYPWIGTVARFFPSIIRDAGDMFLSAYRAGA